MRRISFFLLFFLLHLSSGFAATDESATTISLNACFGQKDFSLNLFLRGAPVGVRKEGCEAKFVLFRGPGERWTLNLCDAEIRFSYQSPLDAPEPEVLYSGSAHCPAPLFGIDLKSKGNNEERFSKTSSDVLGLLHDLKNAEKVKDPSLTSVYGQLTCLNRVMERYLKECVPFKLASP